MLARLLARCDFALRHDDRDAQSVGAKHMFHIVHHAIDGSLVGGCRHHPECCHHHVLLTLGLQHLLRLHNDALQKFHRLA